MTTLAPRPALLPRWVGLAVVLAIAVVSLASIGALFGQTPTGLIAQGPAAVDPQIEDELAVLFDTGLVETSQRVLHVLGIAVFLGLALLLIARRDASNRAPLAAVTLAALGASLFAPLNLLPGGSTIATVVGSITPTTLAGFWGSLAGVALLAFLATFPDGRWIPSWTKWLVGAAALSGVLALLPSTRLGPDGWPFSLQILWMVGLPSAAISAQLIRRNRNPFDKATKLVVFSLVAALGIFLLLWVLRPELTADVLDLVVVTPRLKAVYALNLLVLLTVAVFMYPVSVSVAIVRHRLFDLDLLVNRALVYGTVTALVGTVFLAAALVVSNVAGGTGAFAFDARGGAAAGVALGTGLVLVFQPLRRRVQRGVDRRFYRERYDARRLIDGFAGEAARLVEPSTLESELVSVVEQALHPKSVRLETGPFSDHTKEALAAGVAIDLALVGPDPGLESFRVTGTAVLVPLVAGGSLTGVLDLGPRTSDSRYSALDLELLDRLAQSAGPALQLAHEVQVREREAQNRERATHELELARKIQQGLLPHSFPDLEGWSFNAFYSPAREVGGDFYDWLELSDGRLAVIIGDVSDKGIPAALVMATCRTLLRVSAGSGRPPGDVLAEVNDRIQPDIPSGMFVTCLLAMIDPATGSMALANAGHNLPYRRTDRTIAEIRARGMPLGLMCDMAYEEIEGRLSPGDSLVLTSDGLAEAHAPDGGMYGTERLRQALSRADGDLIAATLESHSQFVGSTWEQEDDITMVTLARAP
ncbi:MAG TPA: SpoIIE family protein phosphatase [Acidimicrobiia bacterium]|nr:SpoIIE family protein phosphatase [Acidimicrobiia bacterium]